jgi:hypothetical protein
MSEGLTLANEVAQTKKTFRLANECMKSAQCAEELNRRYFEMSVDMGHAGNRPSMCRANPSR